MLEFCFAQALHFAASAASVRSWATAGLGAILGAAVGVLFSALYSRYQKRLRFLVLLREVKEELATIKEQCGRRLRGDTGVAGTIDPPLPTEAWRALVATGDLGLLAPCPLRLLRKLYGKIVAANHVAAHWCCLLQIAILSLDAETRDNFNVSAASTLTAPCEEIGQEIDGVISSLNSEISVGEKSLNRARAPWARQRKER